MREKDIRTVYSPRTNDSPRTAAPLRVLLLIKGLGAGGAERLLVSTAELGDHSSFEYEAAYLLPWKTALVDALESSGVKVTCLRGGRAWNLTWTRALRRLLKDRPVEIVHVHSPYVAALARLVVRTLPKRIRPHIISTEHLPWSGHRPLSRIANTLTFPLDTVHIAVSSAVRESIPAPLRRRVRVVVHGIRLEKVQRETSNRTRARADLGMAPDQFVIGTVANLTAQKAYDVLLRAARNVLDRGLNVRFIAIGQGPLENHLRDIHADLGLEDRFTFLGFQDDPPRLLAGCDLFVLPSRYEGLPLALMEALALGLPIVATDVLGIREAVVEGEEAILVPPDRPDLLGEAIASLVHDAHRREAMSAAAKERAKIFDVRHAIATIEQIYGSLALEASGASPDVSVLPATDEASSIAAGPRL